jgi:hypothetical protein
MKRKSLRLLSIDIAAKGFGFVLLDAKRGLLDWGAIELLADDDKAFLKRGRSLIDRGRPTAIVLENVYLASGRENAHRRLGMVLRLAAELHVGICQVSRKVERRVLGVVAKTEIAKMLATRYPELERRIPPDRARWGSEDKRAHIFDALSFAIVVISPEDSLCRNAA